MQAIRPALRLYPALHSAAEDRAQLLAEVRRIPSEFDPPCEPPEHGRAHWEAVWRAVAASAHASLDRESNWEAEQDTMRALARTLLPPPVPRARGDHRLVALVPPPVGLGPKWVAIYLHPHHRELARGWALGSGATVIERVDVPPETQPAILHVAAQALVPVSVVEFDDIHPQFFAESIYEDEDGEPHEWHEAVDFDRMPTDPVAYILAESMAYGSKVGGFAIHNAERESPQTQRGQPMRYGVHLGGDFFDCEFGDAGSLHVWLSDSSDEAVAMMDSA